MYPVMLNIRNKKAVVVGGGNVASRKIVGLVAEGSIVSVISPKINEAIYELVQQGIVHWVARTFEVADVEGAFIIIAATNSQSVNAQVASCCQPEQLVNIVDNPKQSTFHVPAKVQRGDLVIAVSTGGASPLLAKKIRNELAEQYPTDYAEYIAFLAMARQRILAQELSPAKRKALLEESQQQHYYHSVQARQLFFTATDLN